MERLSLQRWHEIDTLLDHTDAGDPALLHLYDSGFHAYELLQFYNGAGFGTDLKRLLSTLLYSKKA